MLRSGAAASGTEAAGAVVVVVVGAVVVVGRVVAGVAVLPLPEHAESPTPTTSESATIIGRATTGPGYPVVPARRTAGPAILARVRRAPTPVP